MATTTSDLNMLRNRINNAVTNIGKSNGTKRPQTEVTDNRAAIAYELAVAQRVDKRAAVRYKDAIKHAIQAGVMFDHKKEPLSADTVKELYSDDVVRVTVRTTNGHTRFNTGKLRDLLVAGGMTFEQVDQLLKAATDRSAVPHEFVADIITADGDV